MILGSTQKTNIYNHIRKGLNQKIEFTISKFL